MLSLKNIRRHECDWWLNLVFTWSWRCCYSLFHSRIFSERVRWSCRSWSLYCLILSWPWWRFSFFVASYAFSHFCTLRPWFYDVFVGLIRAWPREIFNNIILSTHSKRKFRRALQCFFRLIVAWARNVLVVQKRLSLSFGERCVNTDTGDFDFVLKINLKLQRLVQESNQDWQACIFVILKSLDLMSIHFWSQDHSFLVLAFFLSLL